MAKVVLNDVANLITTSIINTNNAILEAAFDNTLSRDGTAPNAMLAPIDMNNNPIINVADGVNPQDVATVAQIGNAPAQAAAAAASAAAASVSETNAAASANAATTSASNAAISEANAAASAASIDPANLVHITGAETITGQKTFTNPLATADPTVPLGLATKQMVDLKAPLDSPAFTGTPSLPTGTTGVTQPAGDNSTKLATTAYADGVASFTSSGYQKLASGLIIQWGTKGSSAGGDVTITFPIAFPNACLSITGSQIGVSTTNSIVVSFGTLTATSVLIGAYSTSGVRQTANTRWIAIGY